MFLNTFECVFEELYGNVKHKYEILPEYTHNVGCLFFFGTAYSAVDGV